ncbi:MULTISPECIES: ImmA/IrrE family metallo-endopeptidase [Pseudoalteromonas]|uniref:ImmA/IrrE family metallo-endopeptidase n=1 Tax=Pseudoalteromonas TaxID=53246 RepID=UPI0003FF5AD2|nr:MULTISPECIES: ImmA/IrrE family metallo-endopeptidase [Pseudoalteromonas]
MELPAVKNILDANWDWRLPVNIQDIAEKLNIKVDSINPFNPDHNDYRGLSGLAEINNQGQRVIYCNSTESTNRNRFTLAHELGHHVLNHVNPQNPCFRDDSNTFSSNSPVWQEREANNFAAQLLMPLDAIKTMLFVKGISNIKQLAEIFQVSEAAMYYRLKNLGYLTL